MSIQELDRILVEILKVMWRLLPVLKERWTIILRTQKEKLGMKRRLDRTDVVVGIVSLTVGVAIDYAQA